MGWRNKYSCVIANKMCECVCRLSGGVDWGGGEMDGEEEGWEWLYELLQEVQLEQFYTKLRDDLQVTRSVFRSPSNQRQNGHQLAEI